MAKDKGFTLIEVLIAVGILAVAITALAGLAGTTIKSTDSGKRRTQAVNIASQALEALRSVPYYDLQSTGTDGGVTRTCTAMTPANDPTATAPSAVCTPSPSTITLGNLQFAWKWKVTYIDLNNNGSYYDPGFSPTIDTKDMKKIDVIVTWNDLFGSHTLTIPTLRKL